MRTPKDTDILIVGSLQQRREFQNWSDRQVFSVSRPDRLSGRRFRNAYYTDLATLVEGWPEVRDLVTSMEALSGSSLLPIEEWSPEPPDLVRAIAALPEQKSKAGRDFGRGYGMAIKDVLALIVQYADVQVTPAEGAWPCDEAER